MEQQNTQKTKVILIQETAMSYREPIYQLMNQKVDLTIGYIVDNQIKDSAIKVMKLPSFKLGPMIFPTKTYSILNNYDVVILLPHFKYLWLSRIAFLPRKFRLVTWTIGLHVSYDCHYDLTRKPSWEDWIFEEIQDRADACIFYMPEPIEYWKKYKKIDERKYFVAHNTVKVSPFDKISVYDNRKSFLFVGTLYKQKGIEELIDAYKQANEKCQALPILNIIGKGPEKDLIEERIKELNLEKKIYLKGPIYDEEILKDYFFDARLCLSPKQAGLSVLKSMGYGVPFVTRTDAITGGEKTNITHMENGLFYNSVEELSEILVDSVMEASKYSNMANNARSYYLQNASPELMAQGALDAISYAMKR